DLTSGLGHLHQVYTEREASVQAREDHASGLLTQAREEAVAITERAHAQKVQIAERLAAVEEREQELAQREATLADREQQLERETAWFEQYTEQLVRYITEQAGCVATPLRERNGGVHA